MISCFLFFCFHLTWHSIWASKWFWRTISCCKLFPKQIPSWRLNYHGDEITWHIGGVDHEQLRNFYPPMHFNDKNSKLKFSQKILKLLTFILSIGLTWSNFSCQRNLKIESFIQQKAINNEYVGIKLHYELAWLGRNLVGM